VVLAPLPFGSTDPAMVAVWCIALGLGLLFFDHRKLHGGRVALLALIVVPIGAYTFVLYQQLGTVPFAAADPNALWAQTAALLRQPVTPSLSIARNQPWFSIGAPLAALMALVLSFIVCADRDRAHRLLAIIAWSGAFYAALGILMFLADPNKVLWRDKLGHQGFLTGTFLNRNTAAVFFGMCGMLWLLQIGEKMRMMSRRERIDWVAVPRDVLMRPSRRLVIAAGMFFLCLTAMFMTASRAGTVLSLVAMVIAFWAYFRRDIAQAQLAVLALPIAAVIVFVLFGIFGASVGSRFDTEGVFDSSRVETYKSTFRMIADHPWYGTGLGTFLWNFPAYRSSDASMIGIWDRAHNSWLELASDMGVPLAGAVITGWIVMLTVLVRGILRRKRDLAVPAAGLAAGLLAVTHSLVDFSLQIPGFAIVVLALLGAGLAQSFRSVLPERNTAAARPASGKQFKRQL
jgi:O-antigen ligase